MVIVIIFFSADGTIFVGGTVIFFAEKSVLSKGEFVAGHQLSVASNAAKAFQVENLVLGSHHEVAGPEGTGALLALGAKEPKVFAFVSYHAFCILVGVLNEVKIRVNKKPEKNFGTLIPRWL